VGWINHIVLDWFLMPQLGYEIYIRWVWYYLGQELIHEPDNLRLYPYNENGKALKKYKYCNDAKRQAILLGNAIKKTIKNTNQ
jgi:hypothetical protein